VINNATKVVNEHWGQRVWGSVKFGVSFKILTTKQLTL